MKWNNLNTLFISVIVPKVYLKKILSTSTNQKQRRKWSSLEKREFVLLKCWRLTAEVWRPPLVDFGSSALASISVGLELVTQYMLLAIELTHVKHTALEEWSGIHHTDTLPGTEKNSQSVWEGEGRWSNTLKKFSGWQKEAKYLLWDRNHTGRTTNDMLMISLVHPLNSSQLISCKNYKSKNVKYMTPHSKQCNLRERERENALPTYILRCLILKRTCFIVIITFVIIC